MKNTCMREQKSIHINILLVKQNNINIQFINQTL